VEITFPEAQLSSNYVNPSNGNLGRPANATPLEAPSVLAGSSRISFLFLDLDVLGRIVIFTLNFRSPPAGWEC
jgi:hypothetical protein